MPAKTLAVLVLLAAAVVEGTRHTMFERKHHPKDWKMVGASPADAVVEFSVALKHHNMEEFEALYWRLSDPESDVYGQWMTKEEIWAMIAPSWDELTLVNDWFLSFAGVTSKHYVDSIRVTAPVSAIHIMFPGSHMKEFHKEGRVIHKLMGALSLPTEVNDLVDMITGISDWPIEKKTRKYKTPAPENLGDQAQGYIIPQTLRRLYSIPNTQKATNPKSTQMAVEFEAYPSFSFADLYAFAQATGNPFTNITKIVGPFQGIMTESTLDVQYITGVGIGATSNYLTATEWMYEYTSTVMNMTNLATVHSISYGWPEAFQCNGFPGQTDCAQLGVNSEQYVHRTDQEFMKLGAMGLSIIVCSQDEGAPSEQNIACQLDDTHPLWPIYPATSPYVLTVGSTCIVDTGSAPVQSCSACQQYQCATGSTEHPAMYTNSAWTVGGGFSDYNSMPAFQAAAVAKYLATAKDLPPPRFFNKTGRAYPDVAALGTNILIQQQGSLVGVGGTSASTPMIAGMVTLLNDMRLNAGKTTLGPIAPLLYKMAAADPTAFNDINFGNNKCTVEACCKYGYTATEGYDPVTGLGTPVFAKWMQYVHSLP